MAQLQHQAIGNYAWMVWIRRSHLPQQIKTVGFVLATYADADGSNATVGQDRLADEAICDERYARDSLTALELLGLIEVTKHGRSAGDADTYQLTLPGAGFPAIPMRRDPRGVPLGADGQPRAGKRPKPLSLRPLLAELQGRPLPDRPMPIDRTGDPSPEPPVDNPSSTGNPVPLRLVPDPDPTDEYRQPGAATEPDGDDSYRQRVSGVPATGCTGTGNPVPPTNLYQLLPNTSPQATPSLAPGTPACGQIQDDADPEFEAARTALAAMTPLEVRAWRHIAEAELEGAGIPLTKRDVAIRTAEVATRAAPAVDVGGAA